MSTIAPIMIASGAFGIYGLVVTIVWGAGAVRHPRHDRAGLSQIGGLLGKEAGIGAIYMTVGLVLVVLFEREGRRTGAFDRF